MIFHIISAMEHHREVSKHTCQKKMFVIQNLIRNSLKKCKSETTFSWNQFYFDVVQSKFVI